MAGGLTEGREQHDAAEWAAAFETLTRVHDQQGLAPADLERLGFSASLTGRDDEAEAILGQAHQAWLDAGPVAAARTAFWIGVVEAEPGLYFVGMHFQYALSSAMVHGVGRDAARIVDHLVANVPVRAGAPAVDAAPPA